MELLSADPSPEVSPRSEDSQSHLHSRVHSEEEMEELVVHDIEKNILKESSKDSYQSVLGLTDSPFSNLNVESALSKCLSLSKLCKPVCRDVYKRLRWYCIILPLLLLLLSSGGQFDSKRLLDLSTDEWIYFVSVTIGINASTSVAENVFFFVIESVWSGQYDTLYCLRSLDGPLGHMMTIVIIINLFKDMKLPDISADWDNMATVLVSVLVIFSLKRYHLRKYYLKLLEERLRDKLVGIESSQTVLSSLASSTTFRPRVVRREPSPGSDGGTGVVSPMQRRTVERVPTNTTGTSNASSGAPMSRKDRMRNVFAEIVRASAKEEEEAADDISEGGVVLDDEGEVELARRERNAFWKRINILNHSMLHIHTSAGEVTIRNKKHAASFARRLYLHVSCGGTIPVTATSLCQAVRSYDDESLSPAVQADLIPRTLAMFGCESETDDIPITQAKIMWGVMQLYKTVKYASGSFSDLQGLNQSVLGIVNVVFWVLVFLLGQIVLRIDTLQVLAPMLTILFGLSFAFAPIISNTFLSLAFVLFLIPYDVGNRVIIGYGSGTQTKGNIASISLFYTTMISIFNEKLVIPNHVLFHERIINLHESHNATFELNIEFCSDGPLCCPQSVIDDFFRNMKHYLLVEKKGEWKEVDIYCVGLDVPKNVIKYSVWASHMGGWGEVVRTLNARTALWEKFRAIQKDLGIKFMKLTEPVEYSVKQRSDDSFLHTQAGEELQSSLKKSL